MLVIDPAILDELRATDFLEEVNGRMRWTKDAVDKMFAWMVERGVPINSEILAGCGKSAAIKCAQKAYGGFSAARAATVGDVPRQNVAPSINSRYYGKGRVKERLRRMLNKGKEVTLEALQAAGEELLINAIFYFYGTQGDPIAAAIADAEKLLRKSPLPELDRRTRFFDRFKPQIDDLAVKYNFPFILYATLWSALHRGRISSEAEVENVIMAMARAILLKGDSDMDPLRLRLHIPDIATVYEKAFRSNREALVEVAKLYMTIKETYRKLPRG